ncbi:hypothetical protein LSAT2_028189 [Lamellibrachia satsuma]|nr:hypothetical protein LSAT2_028189 [Lamellibrachia satsuma]
MRSSYFKCRRLPRLRYVVITGIAGLLTTAHLYLLSAVFKQNVLQIQHEQHSPVRHPSVNADAVNGMPSNKETIQAKSKRVIRIVRWTPPVYNWLYVGSHYFRECTTAIPCEYTNQSSYNSSDIIMINAFHLRNERDLPAYRLPHQKWLFYHTEAPRIGRFKHLTRFLSSFNVTLTYSGNADIVKPYGVCLPNRETIKRNPSSITDYIKKIYGTLTDTTPWLSKEKPYVSYNRAAGKSRLVAWMVSDCTAVNKRSDYAKLLQRYIPVDVYEFWSGAECLSPKEFYKDVADIVIHRRLTQQSDFYDCGVVKKFGLRQGRRRLGHNKDRSKTWKIGTCKGSCGLKVTGGRFLSVFISRLDPAKHDS